MTDLHDVMQYKEHQIRGNWIGENSLKIRCKKTI